MFFQVHLLRLAAMTKQFSVAAGDHGAGVAQQRLDGMTRGRGLPIVAVEHADVENDVGDVLLGRAVPVPIKRLEHASQARPLLPREAGVRRNGPAVQGGQQAANGLDTIEALEIQRNDGDRTDIGIGAVIDDLNTAAISEREMVAHIMFFIRRT